MKRYRTPLDALTSKLCIVLRQKQKQEGARWGSGAEFVLNNTNVGAESR